MIINLIRSLTTEFLNVQHTQLPQDTYTTEIILILKTSREPHDILASSLLKIELDHGLEATYGFMRSLQLLHNLAIATRQQDWLYSQFKALEKLGEFKVNKFLQEYNGDPLAKMQEVSTSLGDPIEWKAYVEYNQLQFGQNFELGAHALVGLLLLAEQDDGSPERALAE